MKYSKRICLAAALGMSVGMQAVAESYGSGGVDYQERPGAGEMLADVALVRPLTLGASALGLIAWVASLPFSIPAGNADESGRAWVGEPLEYTFMRPLGEMEQGARPHYLRDQPQ
ncbi:MAG: hypothetical protein KDI68_13015 [Gammaproteobacteria bacterium]|nr:hypothetical protein [Gammaproteobacteria bacterium]